MSSLHAIGITNDLLTDITLEQTEIQLPELPEVPSYGILLELIRFSEAYRYVDGTKKISKPKAANAILQKLINKMFPLCSVTRADRLGRTIRNLLTPLESFSNDDEKVAFLMKTWRPQPTGHRSYNYSEHNNYIIVLK